MILNTLKIKFNLIIVSNKKTLWDAYYFGAFELDKRGIHTCKIIPLIELAFACWMRKYYLGHVFYHFATLHYTHNRLLCITPSHVGADWVLVSLQVIGLRQNAIHYVNPHFVIWILLIFKNKNKPASWSYLSQN